LFDKIS